MDWVAGMVTGSLSGGGVIVFQDFCPPRTIKIHFGSPKSITEPVRISPFELASHG
jgi:hypothetical protein